MILSESKATTARANCAQVVTFIFILPSLSNNVNSFALWSNPNLADEGATKDETSENSYQKPHVMEIQRVLLPCSGEQSVVVLVRGFGILHGRAIEGITSDRQSNHPESEKGLYLQHSTYLHTRPRRQPTSSRCESRLRIRCTERKLSHTTLVPARATHPIETPVCMEPLSFSARGCSHIRHLDIWSETDLKTVLEPYP